MSTAERLIVGPFNRVEGDLEVHLDITDGAVTAARVNAPMYRGFEQMLLGRDPLDALVYVPRICGICSVSQSIAAAHALGQLSGSPAPPNGQLALNLLLAVENAADHLTHFYLFFMPDFTREAYAGQAWFEEVRKRFAAPGGHHAREALAARARWFEIVGRLGGKWPHTEAITPNGSSRAIDRAEALHLIARVREFRAFLESRLFGAPLESLDGLQTRDDLERWTHAPDTQHSDVATFLRVATSLQLSHLGPGPRNYLSHGAYLMPSGQMTWEGGIRLATHAAPHPLDLAAITEDVSHAWYLPAPALSPALGRTHPLVEQDQAYSWAKAPRYQGLVMETGALARQVLRRHPLLTDLEAHLGSTVLTRVVARLLELAHIVRLAEDWLRALTPGAPYYRAPLHGWQDGQAVGLTEAARGALSHWIQITNGKISRYQIVAPTTWNFSPRDEREQPGALEQALIGCPVQPGERTPVAVQHVVRSFDPCMVCTVH